MHNLVITSKDALIATKDFLNYIDENQVVIVEKISVSLYSISTLRFCVHVKSSFYFSLCISVSMVCIEIFLPGRFPKNCRGITRKKR